MNERQRILVVEDDAGLARVLSDYLVFEGYAVERVTDGNRAIETARTWAPHLILLDVMLPERNGFEVMRTLRQGTHPAVVMLTARGQKADRLRGLNLGADDYVTKPFDFDELLARIRSVLRRTHPTVEVLRLGDISIDFRVRVANDRGKTLHLTHREFELLQYLAERPEQVVYRDELLRAVWGYHETPYTRSVDHAIARLRKKIEPDVHHPRFIRTVHGDGYCFTLTEGSSSSFAGR